MTVQQASGLKDCKKHSVRLARVVGDKIVVKTVQCIRMAEQQSRVRSGTEYELISASTNTSYT